MIIEIPNAQLRTGMQIMREEKPGKFVTEYTLTRFFRTSPVPRFAHLAWRTSAGSTVVYARCGKTFVQVEDSPKCTLCNGAKKIGGMTCRWCNGTGKEPK